jgi:hypothetical protein
MERNKIIDLFVITYDCTLFSEGVAFGLKDDDILILDKFIYEYNEDNHLDLLCFPHETL